MIFSWDDWNIGHIAKHAVTRAEAEEVVRNAAEPFPRKMEERKLMVWGQTRAGRYLLVIFTYREVEEITFESIALDQWIAISDGAIMDVAYVVHAMTLPPKLLKQYRRMRR